MRLRLAAPTPHAIGPSGPTGGQPRQLLARPELRGTVTVQFVLTPDGAIRDLAASGVDPEVAACVRDVVAAVELPRFQTVLAITYPIHFGPPT